MARTLFFLVLSSVLSATAALGGSDRARVHVVARGDSLSEIAERYGIELEELRAWNALESDTIRVGQALEVDRPSAGGRTVHRVRSGETLARIARRYAVSVPQLVAWNEGLAPDRVREGEELVVGEGPPSESVGEPGAGSIRGSVRIAPHAAYVIRDPERAYATRRTLERLVRGFEALHRDDQRAPRVRVHDISLRRGGPIDDHHTHQSGRDVDLTYFQREGCSETEGCPLREVAAPELDAARQWRLLHHWLERGELEVAYVDHALQAELHREARRRGATREQLATWLQYPRSASVSAGVIRHYPNHADHVHVRFACAPGEHHCSPATQGP